jgi:quercetin dioxygenase-like cupin family protein
MPIQVREIETAWAEAGRALETLGSSLKLDQRDGRRATRHRLTTSGSGVSWVSGSTAPPVSEHLQQALRETAHAIPAVGRHALASRPPRRTAVPSDDGCRRVLFTGNHSRLVMITLAPGQELGAETHDHDQIILLLSGEGEHVVDDATRRLSGRTALCAQAGTCHNVRNTGDRPMRIALVSGPAT